MARYVLTAFAHGTLLGASQVAAHMRGQVSVHELSLAGNKHTTANKIDKASAVVINALNKLDVAGMWGDGKAAAADGSQVETWENNCAVRRACSAASGRFVAERRSGSSAPSG
jgi:hypothetical protein